MKFAGSSTPTISPSIVVGRSKKIVNEEENLKHEEFIVNPKHKKSKKMDHHNSDLGGVGEKAPKKKKKLHVEINTSQTDIKMPEGKILRTIDGEELPSELVANALQLIQFFVAFGKVLDLPNGHAKSILQELLNGDKVEEREQDVYVVLPLIHIQLLIIIHEDRGITSPSLSARTGKNWLQALGVLVAKSRISPSDEFKKDPTGYEKLSGCEKLKLLNFLCDEALSTSKLRNFIKEQHAKHIESQKELTSNVVAANTKVRELEKRLKNELPQALTTNERKARVKWLQFEVDRAHAERLEAEGEQQSKGTQRSDALRTQPILLVENGCVFWKLKGYSEEPNFLLQDFGAWDSVTPHEKWVAYTIEQKYDLLKYLSSSRTKRYLSAKHINNQMHRKRD
ncbi:hypothetical protein ACFE04_007988 [Oxalis oulophora]